MQTTPRSTSLNKLLAPAEIQERCKKCNGKTVKVGRRKTSNGLVQKYQCLVCKVFSSSAPLPRRHYTPTVILNAITCYNMGNTLAETKTYLVRRFKKNVPHSTLHAWLTQFKDVCTFVGYRKKYALSEDVIVSKTFSHRQEYKFAFHRLKTNLFCKTRFPELRKYVWDVYHRCPHGLFTDGENGRCSDTSLRNVNLAVIRQPDNNAVSLARLGLLLAQRATERHQAVQRFMLANDTATIAVEIPIYLYPNEAPDLGLAAPLTGHIDILQVRYDHLYILDYKPDARHETKAKYQTYLYARALCVRTGVPLDKIRWAYFDDKDYYAVSVD